MMGWRASGPLPAVARLPGWLALLLPACSLGLGLDDYRERRSEQPPPDAGSCEDANGCLSLPPDDGGTVRECTGLNDCPSPAPGVGLGNPADCLDADGCPSPRAPVDSPRADAGCTDPSMGPGCNAPPSAAADTFQAAVDAPLEVPAPGLLANDTDPEGAGLTARAGNPTTRLGGSVSIGENGAFTYTPPPEIADPAAGDSFEYTAVDARGAEAQAEVRIAFMAAIVDRYQLTRGPESFTLDAASGLLANDVGDGVRVTAIEGATLQRGRLSVSSDGSFVYEPPSTTFWGDDAFDYTLTDGTRQTSGRVRLVVQPGTLSFDDIATERGNGFALDVGTGDVSRGECIAAAGDTDGDGLGDISFIAGGLGYLLLGSSRSLTLDVAFIGEPAPGTVFTSIDPLTTVAGAGDVNADGFDDIAFASTTTVFVVFGGLEDTFLELDQLLAGSDPRGFAITGGSFASGAPSPVAGAGDVNGDGFADVVIGDPVYEGRTGRAFVIFGKASTTAIDLAAGGFLDGFIMYGVSFGEITGTAVAGAGDVNGDGLDDVIIGSHQSLTRAVSTGKAFIVFGKRDRGLVELSQIADGAGGGFAIVGAASNDFVGHSVARAGDVNGDGLDDVVVGANFAFGEGGTAGPGSALVVFGKADAAPVLASDLQNELAGGFVIRGVTPSDQVGYSVSGAGDVNGDGRGDVVIGAYSRGAYIVLGKASTNTIRLADSEASGAAILTSVERSGIGSTVSGGDDINGDGLSDVLIGSIASDADGLAFYTLYGWDMSATLGERESALRGHLAEDSFDLPGARPIAIRGGHGNDTLRLIQSAGVLDLTASVPRIESIETIDLRGNGPQTVRLDDRVIRRLPASRVGVTDPLAKTLIVLGDSEDHVDLDFAGFERLADNAGRAVYRRSGAFYGLELSAVLAPP